MKRFLVAIALFSMVGWIGAAIHPQMACAAREKIYYFSIHMWDPCSHQLIPLIVYYNDHLARDQRVHIPHGAKFKVKVIASKGRYLSIAFRDDGDTIFDLPFKARHLDSDTKEIWWTMPPRFMPGDVEVSICLWSNFDPDARIMVNRIENSGWITLGDTGI